MLYKRNGNLIGMEWVGIRLCAGLPELTWELVCAVRTDKHHIADPPHDSPSIRAAVNQTIMSSLAMVIVASLIGAKGFGEDVLEVRQHANDGQGVLEGFSILFCAIILDRIV